MKKIILLTSLAFFIIIVLLPAIWIGVDSFFHQGHLSFESYKNVLMKNGQGIFFLNTIRLAFCATLLSLLIGVPLGFLLERVDLSFHRFVKYLYLVPLIIPPHIHAIAWISLLGTNGFINQFLNNLFHLETPIFTIYGLVGSVLILGLSYFPIITALTISGLRSIDQQMEDAGKIITHNFDVTRRITLPLVLPHIIAGAVFVFIFSMINYGVPSLLRVNVFPVEIFAQFSAFYDSKGAVALSMPLVLIAFILILVQDRYMKDKSYITIGAGAKTLTRINPGNWQIAAWIFEVFIILVSVVLPITILFYEAGSLASYITAVKTAHKQILTSLGLSVIAATVAVSLSFFIAYILEKTQWQGKGIIKLFSFLPFIVLPAILGIGMIQVWNRPQFDFIYTSSAIVVVVFMARFSPFALQAISANLRQININLEEAACLSHVTWQDQILKILIPLANPGLITGWIMVFILSMGELGASLLVMPPGQATLSIRIYTLMHYGAGNLVASLCLILIAITLIPISILLLLNSWYRKSNLDRRKTYDPNTEPEKTIQKSHSA
ncbi:MAG: iron ABC transporter permease [Desulfobacula sp.]|uniref:ABC transporter permease n=1 Tax=Desulfobacula sp. TaxID=2593537 RepID=UPI0025C3F541|nr:iron ABC transporter permease [Desulfobacula sp.]MCD4722379.1 iron ABC transporter permease [Desulfobacula sp.]